MSIIFIATVVLISLYSFTASGSFIKSSLFSAVSGGLGLCAVHIAGIYSIPLLAMTPFTIGTGLILGLPGVIGMLMLKMAGIF